MLPLDIESDYQGNPLFPNQYKNIVTYILGIDRILFDKLNSIESALRTIHLLGCQQISGA